MDTQELRGGIDRVALSGEKRFIGVEGELHDGFLLSSQINEMLNSILWYLAEVEICIKTPDGLMMLKDLLNDN